MSENKKAICIRDCKISIVPDFLQNDSNLKKGTLVQVLYQAGDYAVIQLYSYFNRTIEWKNDVFKIKLDCIKVLTEHFFNILLAVKSDENRAQIIETEKLTEYITNLQVNQVVVIPGNKFRLTTDLNCIIKYVGAAPEIGPGIFYGFQIVDPNVTIPIKGTLARKYMDCSNDRGFLRSADVVIFQLRHTRNNRANDLEHPFSFDNLTRSRSLYESCESLSSQKTNQSTKSYGSSRNNRPRNNRNKNRGDDNNSLKNAVQFEKYPRENPNYNQFLLPQNEAVMALNNVLNTPHMGMQQSRNIQNPRNSRTMQFERFSTPNFRPNAELGLPDLRRTNDIHPKLRNTPNFTRVPENIMQGIHMNTREPRSRDGKIDPEAIRELQRKIQELRDKISKKKNITNQNTADIYDNVHNNITSKCKLKSCPLNGKRWLRNRDDDIVWCGSTIAFTNSQYKKGCEMCNESLLKCVLSSFVSLELKCYLAQLKLKGLPVSLPVNEILSFENPRQVTRKKQNDDLEIGAMSGMVVTKFSLKNNHNKTNCSNCDKELEANWGICIRACSHVFCRRCLESTIESSYSVKIQCPYNKLNNKCNCDLMENEIKLLVSTVTYRRLKLNTNTKKYQCKTNDCKGSWLLEPETKTIKCKECNEINCTICEAIHTGYSCKDYQILHGGSAENALSQWDCQTCTFSNPEHVLQCNVCGTKKLKIKREGSVSDEDSDNDSENETIGSNENDEDDNQFQKLLDLDDVGIIRNTKDFECTICYCTYGPGKGVRLRECFHEFCDECLVGQIKVCAEVVKCPYADDKFSCECKLQDREIRSLLTQEQEMEYYMRSVQRLKSQLEDGFQCRTLNCLGFWCYDENITSYICNICNQKNCHQCQAIHTAMTCLEYQEKLKTDKDPAMIQTRKLLEEMLLNGTAMKCPKCRIIIARDEGCSWITCSMCRVEICWATRGPRWGPNGKGDISGGCKCDFLNNRPCHRDCNYCH